MQGHQWNHFDLTKRDPALTLNQSSHTSLTQPSQADTLRLVLPQPTYASQDPNKKSHARKQPKGHVPRPRNAFMLFRSDFVRQKKVPEDVENDQGNISRIAGTIWRAMTEQDKAPWVGMAEQEKMRHQQAYPGYRYAPVGGGRRKNKERREERPKIQDPERKDVDLVVPIRRSSSCPPGATHVPNSEREGFAASNVTRDDLERRPSRVILYQSTPIGSTPEVVVPRRSRGLSFGPAMNTGPFSIMPPVYMRGWDGPPPQPIEWTQWDWSQQNYDTAALTALGEQNYIMNALPELNWNNINPFAASPPPTSDPYIHPSTSTPYINPLTVPTDLASFYSPGMELKTAQFEDYSIYVKKMPSMFDYSGPAEHNIEVLFPKLTLTDTRPR